MASSEQPVGDSQRIVIAGGGVAGLEAMLALRAVAADRAAITLLCPHADFVYQPLATGAPFELGEVTHYPLERLTTEHDAELVEDAVSSVDADRHAVRTEGGREIPYDKLIVALGATRSVAFEGALTFGDEDDVPAFRNLLDKLREGHLRRVAFLVPDGVAWPFPLYELALMTGALAREHGLDVELTLVTPASGPLALFGEEANAAMTGMLSNRGITVRTGNTARLVAPTRALLEPDGEMVHADRFVALPRLSGPRLPGLSHDIRGFIPTDDHGRVQGTSDVYAAGDCTTYPFKQGGLAAQQADAVAAAIAAELGVGEEPAPFRPVLRGLLLTGEEPRYLRSEGVGGHSGGPVADHALWWPPTKIAGRYLAPCLGVVDAERHLTELGAHEAVHVAVELAREPELLE
jgi:sulfide:quinone oxidoreductase